MQEPKTKPTTASVAEFLNKVEPEQKRKDSFALLELFENITGEKAVMWGPSIVGFGKYTLKYANGQEADWPMTGFSPRKEYLTLYLNNNLEENKELFKRLGKHSISKACLYIKGVSDIDIDVLSQLITNSYNEMVNKYK